MTGGTAGDITFSRGENPLRADKLNAGFVERVLRAGDSMTGPFILVRDPVVPFEAATKQYVDGRFSIAQVSAIPPPPSPGKLWFDINTGQLFVWYDDGSSAQWVIANNLGAAGAGGGGFLPLTGGTIGTPGWLEALIPTTETNSDFVSLANRGGSAGVFGTRSSNAPGTSGSAQNAWALGGFAVNDNATQVQTAFGAYFEARRNASTGLTYGTKIAVVNRGAVFSASPRTRATTGMIHGLQLSAGRTDVTPNNNPTAALLITSAGAPNAQWQSGIIFSEGALALNSAYPVAPVVLDMPQNYSLLWRDSTDRPAAYIRSDVTVSPDYHGMGGIVFTNTGVQLNSATGQATAVLNNTAFIVTGALSVAGTTTIGGQLAVGQGAAFASSVLVVGPTILKDTLTVRNSADGNTAVIEASSGNISSAGTTLIGTDLTVGRNATITGTTQVNGPTTINSTLSTSGDASFTSNVSVTGFFSVQAGARINGLSPYVNNAAAIAAGHVTGDVYFNTTVGALSVTL